MSGTPIERLLSASDRQAMASRLYPQGCATQFCQGPLWLAAPKEQLVSGHGRALAFEGFLADGEQGAWDLARLLEGESGPEPEPRIEGHYVLVLADTQRGLLSLFRDPTGAERIFYAQAGDILFFSSSVKPLLAHPRVSRRLNEAVLTEVLLSGLVHFGADTLWNGILEVLPGHRLRVSGKGLEHRWVWGDLLKGERGDPRELAVELRRRLGLAVKRSIGRDRSVAVMLSGGIDSSAVAALAAETVGPENVTAFTYEFEDPAHPSEVPHAAQVCRHLRIGRHEVVRISREEYLESIPQAVWLSDNHNEWMKIETLAMARRVRERGFSKCLTGSGIGSHMGYLEQLASLWPRVPQADWAMRYWNLARTGQPRWAEWLGRLHPGLAPPAGNLAFRLYYPILCVFRHNGILSKLSGFFPSEIGAVIEEASLQPRVRQAIQSLGHLPLARQLQHLSFFHLNAQVDVSRPERMCRQVGVLRISPAFFPSCLPWTYFPFKTEQPFRNGSGRLRPGKFLLREAMRERLPEAVLFRRKDWGLNYAPAAWRLELIKRLRPFSARISGRGGPDIWRPPRGIHSAHFALWHRLFIENPPPAGSPSWSELDRQI